MPVTVPAPALAKKRPPGLRNPSHEGGPANKTTRRWCRARVRRAGVLAVAAGLALSTAACSGGTPSTVGTATTGSTSSTGSTASSGTGGASSAYVSDKLGLARCLRTHGVPNYPDPNATGQEPPNSKQLISTPQGQAAVSACSYWGNRMHNDVAAQSQAVLAEYVRFAQCMRSHGLPNFPDPVNSEGRVEFVLSASQDGFDPHSPQVLAKAHDCEHVLPAGSGLPQVEVTS
jgi:hypothetical protein